MKRVTAGLAVKYIVLPGLLPRVRALFFNGFALLAYYVALIYGMARLIPKGHPYLNQNNIGQFGIREAVFVAWRNLDFQWKNIDRILFFFCLVAGLILMLAYILGAAFYLVTVPAMATSIEYGQLFTNPNPHDDIAFMMLDRMLGVPDVFRSKVETDQAFGPFPNAFHYGLQALFAYFSWGLFAVAVMLLLYFIVEIVLETTMTGTPFGSHFDNIWIPLRIVAGLGLLIPISDGLNSAQYITLYVAKAGSNFATNAWVAFNEGMGNPMGVENEELLALPVTPDFTGYAKDLFTIRACKDVHDRIEYQNYITTHPPAPNSDGEIVVTALPVSREVDAFFVEQNGQNGDFTRVLGNASEGSKIWPTGYASNFLNLYAEGLRFYNGRDIRVVFGTRRLNMLDKYPGGVEPICGEITIPNYLSPGQKIPEGDVTSADINENLLIGASHMFATFRMLFDITKTGYGRENGGEAEREAILMKFATDRYFYQQTATGIAMIDKREREMGTPGAGDENPSCVHDSDNDKIDNDGDEFVFNELGPCTGPPANEFFIGLVQKYQRFFSYGPMMGYDYFTGLAQQKLDERCIAMDNCSNVASGSLEFCQRQLQSCNDTAGGYSNYKPLPSVYYQNLGQENPTFIERNVNSGLFKYGWGGAGIWYKKIAETNGGLTGSTNALPRVTHFPMLMEEVATTKAATDKAVASGGCERFNPSSAGKTPINISGNAADSHATSKLFYSLCSNLNYNEHMKLADVSNVRKTGNPLLDVIDAMFGSKMLFNFRENSGVNPMSQLAALGRALIDKAVQNVMMGVGGSAVGGLMAVLGQTLGEDGGAIAPLLAGAGTITKAISSMVVSFAMTGLVAGIILFYVVPFMPFMYFFFAVGAWVKSVFEALVGVPLWALAHVRMDESPGFAGRAATGGYYLLLEIFIRPIVTLFALVASMVIFMALASMLNTTWGLVTSNLVGFDPMAATSNDPLQVAFWRPRVDQFFFTVIYIIFMYMTATGSFKLIDQIPDSIMRWLNEVRSFGSLDSSEEQVSGVSMTVGYPVQGALSRIGPATSELVSEGVSAPVGIVGDLRAAAARMAPPTHTGG